MADQIIDISVIDSIQNVELTITPNLISINVNQISGNIITNAAWGDISGNIANQTDLQYLLSAKQDDLNGLGFVKANGTLISYDNSTYLTAITSGLVISALGYTPENNANKGIANGYAGLNSSGIVPTSQLPSLIPVWGTITGTLSSQTDLQNALNSKQVTLTENTFYNFVETLTALTTLEDIDRIAVTDDSALLSKKITFTNVKAFLKTYFDNIYTTTSFVNAALATFKTTNFLDATSSIQTQLNGKQAQLNGTGFVKASGTSITYDNNTYLTGINSSQVIAALGYTPYNSTNPAGYISGITSGLVISALGYTPYNATNPDGYTTNVGTVFSVGGTGTVSGLTLTGSVTTSGNLTLGGTLSLTSGNVTTALGYTPENAANKGIANGYASLDGGGLIPSSQLPSYVDDVLEFADLASFPSTGVTGKIYVALDSNKIYRWSGATYIEVSAQVGTIWGGITGTLSNQVDLQNALDAKQDDLNGTGFVKISGTTISYDNSTYYLASNPSGYTTNTGTVTSVAALTLGTTGTDLSSSVANGSTTAVITLNVPTASALNRGALSSADWSTFNGKENVLTFSTGLSRSGNTITNTITQYTDALARASLSGTSPITYNSTTGAIGIQVANTSQSGFLSSTDWNTFNNKAAALSGTTNYLPKFTSASAIGNSAITDDGTTVSLISRALSGTSATFTTSLRVDVGGFNRFFEVTEGNIKLYSGGNTSIKFGDYNTGVDRIATIGFEDNYFGRGSLAFTVKGQGSGTGVTALSLASTGAATFSSSITATSATFSADVALFSSLRVKSANYSATYNTSLRSDGIANGILQLGNNNINYILAGNTDAGGFLSIRVNVTDETLTSGIEAMRLTSAGNVGIGTTSPTLKLEVDNTTTGEQCSLGIIKDSVDNVTNLSSKWYGSINNSIKFHRGSNTFGGEISFWTTLEGGSITQRMRITSQGNILMGTSTDNGERLYVSGAIRATGTITANSDISLKKNLLRIENALEKVEQISGYTYNLKDESDTKRYGGVVAQEIESVFPEIVSAGNDGLKGVEYGNISALLIEAIKEQQTQINELKALLNK